MKKYKLFITLAASLFLTSSCYDLDVYPEDQLSSGTFFQTQDHADQIMMGVYSQMQSDDIFGRQFGLDCLGGIGSGYDPASYAVIGRGTYNSTSGLVTGKFKNLYEAIARANILLQNVDRCDMSDELKLRYKAEARFMRALYYFTLMDFFGPVPVYDESTIVAEDFMNMLEPRKSLEEVRKFIIDDLDNADTYLPTEWDASNAGRATKAAAMSLKGKVLLYAKEYEAAKECFEAVVTNKEGKYGEKELYPDYAGLFKPGGDESSEMIFAIQNIGGVGQDFGMPTTFYMGSRASYGSCWNNVMASIDFVDSYECKNGKPFDWNDYFEGYNENIDIRKEVLYAKLDNSKKVVTYPASRDKLLEMYENRDPRMKASIILPYTHYAGWVKNAPKDTEFILLEKQGDAHENNGFIRVNQNYQLYLWRKFVAEGNMDGAINNRADTPINFPIIRLADVYLMLAECYNQMENGDQEKAVYYINKVRNRASVNMPEINNGDSWMEARTKEEVFARIRHERAVELAAEGWSFSDMRRWGLLEEVAGPVKDIVNKKLYDRVVNERDYLWPIPQDEIDKNPNLRPNNPGW